MGDRGDHRSPDPLCQDGGHGRPRPLPGARPSQSQIQGLGARLRSRRLAEGRRRAGQAARSQGDAGTERGGGGAVLSGDLLVLDAQDPGCQPVRRQERHSRKGHPGRVAHRDQEQSLRRLSPTRPAVHPHDPGGIGRVQVGRRRVAPAHDVRPGRAVDDQPAGRGAPRGGRPKLCGGGTPPRPQGVERNIVVTTWDWGTEKQYLHDLISSDRRNPTVNANGKLFGSPEYATDVFPILDPKTNTVTTFKAPVRDPEMPESLGPGHAAVEKPVAPSPYWGEEKIWDSRVNNHNAMFDGTGRVRLPAGLRGPDNPDFCKKGSDHPSAKAFPIEKNVRQLAILDPKSMKYTFVDTCFGSHHVQCDAKDRAWTSGAGALAGWVDMKIFDQTGDAAKSQGWSPFVLDINGNGKRDEYVEPNQPMDAAKDMPVTGGSGTYAVMPNPADGSIWYTVGVFAGRGGVMRYDPDTQLSEVFNVPMPGFGPRGGDIDSKGVVWVSLASGHIGSFDRSKCKGPLNGPKATGDHCPEGV